MCGINVVIRRRPSSGGSEPVPPPCDAPAVVARRGPDKQHTVQVTTELYAITLTASVLHLRGDAPCRQPVASGVAGSDVGAAVWLLWNGEVWGGLHVPPHSADTMAVLGEVASHATDVPAALNRIQGPWAAVVWEPPSQRLWFGRDRRGRRSLLMHHNAADAVFQLSSVATTPSTAWVEVPPHTLHCLDCSAAPSAPAAWVPTPVPWPSAPHDEPAGVAPPDADGGSPVALPPPDVAFGVGAVAVVADELLRLLGDAVRRRVQHVPMGAERSTPTTPAHAHPPASVAVLFSGGIDSVILAALAHMWLPPEEALDLVNVGFDPKCRSTDRVSAVAALHELRALFPDRVFRLVCVDHSMEEVHAAKPHIAQLVHPRSTEMDMSIGTVLWFASQGVGTVYTSEPPTPPRPRASEPAAPPPSLPAAQPAQLEATLATTRAVFATLPSDAPPPPTAEPPAAATPATTPPPPPSACARAGCRFQATRQCARQRCPSCCRAAVWQCIRTAQAVAPGTAIVLPPDTACPAHAVKLPSGVAVADSGCDATPGERLGAPEALPPLRGTEAYTVTARVLLLGIGADELMAGYGRHRTAYRRGGWRGLQQELALDNDRLWERNLGRDDRCCSDHGREVRTPFLDESVERFLSAVPLPLLADFSLPPGQGDKQVLRVAARRLGLNDTASRVKRAMQFGTRIAQNYRKASGASRSTMKGTRQATVVWGDLADDAVRRESGLRLAGAGAGASSAGGGGAAAALGTGSGASDAGASDAGASDAGASDAGAGASDAAAAGASNGASAGGALDTRASAGPSTDGVDGVSDAGASDAGALDAGASDAGAGASDAAAAGASNGASAAGGALDTRASAGPSTDGVDGAATPLSDALPSLESPPSATGPPREPPVLSSDCRKARLLNKLGTMASGKRAVGLYRQALALDPTFGFAWHNLGSALSDLGMLSAALPCFAKAAELEPTVADAFANAGGVCVKLGRHDAAIDWCQQALGIDPAFAVAHFNLNSALRCAGRHTDAVARTWAVLRSVADATGRAAIDALLADDGADAGGGSGGGDATAVTVVCIKWGRKYGPEYVNRLAAGLRRHMDLKHHVVCFTDDPTGVDTTLVTVRALPTDRPSFKGWWTKSLLFDPAVGLTGRLLFIDLDVVITGPMHPLTAYAGPFAVLSTDDMANERRTGGFNSSIMMWQAGAPAVVRVFTLLQTLAPAVFNYVHRLDHWLEMALPHAAIIQSLAPGSVVEYKGSAVDAVPAGASVVVFPLHPKPHHVCKAGSWVQELWVGDVDT